MSLKEVNLNSRNKLLIIVFVLMIIAVFIGCFVVFKKDAVFDEGAGSMTEKKKNPFDKVSLEAKSAFVWDVKENKVLFGLNEEVQLPLASITKLMTALLVTEIVPEGTIITIKRDDILPEGDNGLRVGERWVLSDVLDFTLVASSNDGAHALASVIGFVKPKQDNQTAQDLFIDEMNKRARKLGLAQTFFLSESGLDLNGAISGSYGSARDVATLMGYIIENKPEILEATKYAGLEISSKDYIHSVENTNKYVESIPGIIGSKTGFTDLAGGNLVVAFDVGIGHPVVAVVLGSSREGRFADIEKLVEASIEKVAQR